MNNRTIIILGIIIGMIICGFSFLLVGKIGLIMSLAILFCIAFPWLVYLYIRNALESGQNNKDNQDNKNL